CVVIYSIPTPPSPSPFPYTTLFRSRVRRLPEQEVREPGLARSADDQVRVGKLRCVQVRRKQRLVDPIGRHALADDALHRVDDLRDRKSTRLNSSHGSISYAVFCLKK